ncbi:hypothetical protein JTB14_014779 [Gonioctena quinquepunctata]|nr:hypothetical protein JTB14_014779 [Gonioctena quinquepunctata]
MISVIRNIHDKASVRLLGSEGYTNPCDVKTGVLQARDARGINLDNKRELLMLLYADDLVIFSESEVEFGENLRILEEYSDQLLLQVNVAKTQIVSFSRGTRLEKIRFLYMTKPIDIVEEFVYLLSSLFNMMSRTTVGRAKHATGSVIALMSKTKIDC